MANVLHFVPEGSDEPVCGTRVFLCAEYTDNREHVDCKRCRRTKLFKNYDPIRYDVDVWGPEGDVIDGLQRGSQEEVDEIRERYADEPHLDVVVKQAS